MQRSANFILTVTLLACIALPVMAQQTMVYQDPEAGFRMAMELYQKEKYAMAREKFLDIAGQFTEKESLARARAEYMAAVCGFELFNNNADLALEEFLYHQHASTLIPQASLQMGKMEYRKGNFHKAVHYLTRVDPRDIDPAHRDEYLFKLGYSYLRANEPVKAEQTLARIKDPNSLFAAPATYFMAHIAYANKDYPKALGGFKKLTDDPTFKTIVPFYLAQIYFIQKDDEKLMQLAPGLLSTANVKRGPEIARMIGETHFKNKQFTEAVTFLQHYIDKSKASPGRQDYYQIAFTYYQLGDYPKAIEYFNKTVGEPDTLSQNAFYHLGDCYVKTQQKKFALNAFYAAYKEGLDFLTKEDALFNYAKLSYELSYNPYNEAVKALKQYISEYPDSKRIDEANTYLVNLYLSTKNYKDALQSLETIKHKDSRLNELSQRLLYYRGIEEFNDARFNEARQFFTKAATSSEDRAILASSLYWAAECHYRQGNYPEAIEVFRQFQLSPGAFVSAEYPLADYNIGYCYFKLKEYDKAIVAFRKFFTNKDRADVAHLNDAFLRTGDCYFVSRSYPEAIDFYNKAINLKRPDRDYAYYQKALALGAAGQLQEKAATLQELTESHPTSSFQTQARYELGISYLSMQQESKALNVFQQLMSRYPNSHYVKDALLRTGLIYYNQDKNDLALTTFKKVVGDFPGTPESKEALMSIRNIYVDMNKVDDFFVYAKNLSFASVTDAEQDSLTYLAAENQYMAKDCNSASRGFKNYLEKFQQGVFRTQAHFYMAECLYRGNQAEDALKSYLYVINEPRSAYTETALLNVSAIYFSRKDYEKALTRYQGLKEVAEFPTSLITAQTGIMRCNSRLDRHEDCLAACQELVANENASNELLTEAYLAEGKAALALDRIPLAQVAFEKTYKLAKNEMGAEASFKLASIQFMLGNYKETEKMIFDFINEFPSYDYWLAKSFILLADLYVKLDNQVQAKQTLQSIIDNYEGADLVAIARQKLDLILETEKQKAIKQEEEAKKAREKENEINLIKMEQESLFENK